MVIYTLNTSLLAIVLVVAVFILCGAFLLVATTFLTTPGTRTSTSQHAVDRPHLDKVSDGVQTDLSPLCLSVVPEFPD